MVNASNVAIAKFSQLTTLGKLSTIIAKMVISLLILVYIKFILYFYVDKSCLDERSPKYNTRFGLKSYLFQICNVKINVICYVIINKIIIIFIFLASFQIL